jgi:uncharacterized protein YecE (DUF72 family)
MPTKAFHPEDFEAFLALLPRSLDGRTLRHVLDVRHASFATPQYLALAARYGCVTVHTDAESFPNIQDADADFAYLRLMRSRSDVPSGYPPAELAAWAKGARAWTQGQRPRDVFIYFINGAKERAPAAALALTKTLVGAIN